MKVLHLMIILLLFALIEAKEEVKAEEEEDEDEDGGNRRRVLKFDNCDKYLNKKLPAPLSQRGTRKAYRSRLLKCRTNLIRWCEAHNCGPPTRERIGRLQAKATRLERLDDRMKREEEAFERQRGKQKSRTPLKRNCVRFLQKGAPQQAAAPDGTHELFLDRLRTCRLGMIEWAIENDLLGDEKLRKRVDRLETIRIRVSNADDRIKAKQVEQRIGRISAQ